MTDQMSEEQIYEEAKKRVEEKKGFRTHAIVYAVINAFLALIWWLTGAGFPWFVFALSGWGIGLLFHGLGVYVLSGRQEDRRAIEREAEKIRSNGSKYLTKETEEEEEKKEREAEYNSATETIKACMVSFRLHRRHRKMIWAIYSRTDFSHLKGGIG